MALGCGLGKGQQVLEAPPGLRLHTAVAGMLAGLRVLGEDAEAAALGGSVGVVTTDPLTSRYFNISASSGLS